MIALLPVAIIGAGPVGLAAACISPSGVSPSSCSKPVPRSGMR